MAEPAEFSESWQLTKMRERAHVLAALALANARWRDVLVVVADSADPVAARARLRAEFALDEIQATAVLDAQYRRLAGSERARIESELADLRGRIAELERAVGEVQETPSS